MSANVSASVHARLLNLARAQNRSFNDLLQLYAMERFLYRLSESSHARHFVLKGALLLRAWDPAMFRTTRDIDLLGRMSSDVADIMPAIAAVCQTSVRADGLHFDPATIEAEQIIEDADYQGLRIEFLGHLGSARLNMRIDIGFGDAVTPASQTLVFPVLLDMPAPRLAAYPPETVIAEKFQVMLVRGLANSRMKDFYDLWWLASNRMFDGAQLAAAVRATCDRRGTPVPARPTALTESFSADTSKAVQWHAFRRRLTPTIAPESFPEVVERISELLQPIAGALESGQCFHGHWAPPGPWRTASL